MKTKRAFLVEPKRFELREVDVEPAADELLVKVTACGLCNWELNHWSGKLGSYPQTLGHEWSGVVVSMGHDVERFKIGDKVTSLPDSLNGFSEYTVVSYKNAVLINKALDEKFILGEPLKCIVTVLKAAAPQIGDFGVIVGCGPMGLWCLQGLRGGLMDSLIAVDTDDNKLKLAEKNGARYTINPLKEDVGMRIREITGSHMADFVIEGTGNPNVLSSCVPYLKAGSRGRLILMSSYEEASSNFDFRPAIEKGIEIMVAHPGYSLDQMDDLRRAVNLQNSGRFDLSKIVTHVFTLDNIQEAFETLEHKPRNYIKGIVVPSSDIN